jgi:hypothetical protein
VWQRGAVTETAARRDEHRSGAPPIFAALWIAFFALAAFSSGTLDTIWDWLRGLPLAAEIVMWIVALPWAVGLAVWESSWDTWARVLVAVLLALLTSGMFARKR